MITNPEDTGIYNSRIREFVDVVHEAGGVCAYDQANANGILTVTRARDAGFDLCQFNLHKTFGAPHGAAGLATGACGASRELSRFLPRPIVRRDGGRYYFDDGPPESIGKIRSFHGVLPTIVRAYAWVLSLGGEGLRTTAETAVLNNNYVAQRLGAINGISIAYGSERPRLEQVRYSLAELAAETGVGTLDIGRRLADYCAATSFTSHHPWVVPEPMTIEPVESMSRARLDLYVDILTRVMTEAREDSGIVKNAPHDSTVHRIDQGPLDDPARWAPTWAAHVRKTRRQGSVE
jgi:glycine dehydrogenase subunit 2